MYAIDRQGEMILHLRKIVNYTPICGRWAGATMSR